MKYFYYIFFIILICAISPVVYAQVLDENSMQKSVKVNINPNGDVHVTHVIKKSNSPHQVELINGTITNLSVKDQKGNAIQFGVIDNNSFMLFPSKDDIIIEYDLSDVLNFEKNVWSWDFLYLESTSFFFPEGVDLVFVDDKPAFLADKKGIICHGCQMKLNYLLNEPKFIKEVKTQTEKFPIEFRTFEEISNFKFDKDSGGIKFQVEGDNSFVTTTIPIKLISDPYSVLLDNQKIIFHKFNENGTHVWLNLKPEHSGEISILGTLNPDLIYEEQNLLGEFPVEILSVILAAIVVIIVVIFFKKRK